MLCWKMLMHKLMLEADIEEKKKKSRSKEEDIRGRSTAHPNKQVKRQVLHLGRRSVMWKVVACCLRRKQLVEPANGSAAFSTSRPVLPVNANGTAIFRSLILLKSRTYVCEGRQVFREVVQAISTANEQVLIAGTEFTCKSISSAFNSAKNRMPPILLLLQLT
jgi:hypothetical protein